MAEPDVKIIVGVDIPDLDQEIKELADLRTQIDQLKAAQKEQDRTTEEGRVAFEKYGIQIKQAQAALRAKTNEVNKAVQAQKAESGSLQQLSANLSTATAAYNKLSAADRASAQGQNLAKYIATTREELKSARAELGDYTMNVGNYTNAIEESNVATAVQQAALEGAQRGIFEIRNELRELQKTPLSILPEEEARAVLQRIADVRTELQDTQRTIAALDTDNTFSLLAENVNFAVASVNLLANGLSAVGVQSSSIDKIKNSAVQLIAVMQSLNIITTAIRKNRLQLLAENLKIVASNVSETLAKRALVATTNAETAATTGATAAKIKYTVQAKLATAAQWLWNAAVSANPLGALVVAITAAIVAIKLITSWLNSEAEAVADVNRLQEQYNTLKQTSTELLQKYANEEANNIAKIRLEYRKQLNDLKAAGATKEQLAAAELERDEKIRQQQEHSSRLREFELKEELRQLDELMAAQEALLESGTLSANKYREIADAIRAERAERAALIQGIYQEQLARENLAQDRIEAATAVTTAVKSAGGATKDAVAEAIKAFDQEVERNRETRQALLKAEADYQKKDLASRQAYARRSIEIDQEAARKKLDNLKQNNRITEEEYKRSLEVLDAELTAFTNGQIAELNAYWEQQREQLLGMVEKTADEQIASIEKKYKKALETLEKIEPPQQLAGQSDEEFAREMARYEEFLLQRAQLEVGLERAKQKEVTQVQQNELRQREQLINKELDDAYAEQLIKATNNEEKRLKILDKALREEIAKRKAAGLQTYTQEQQLEENRLKLQKLYTDKAYLEATGNIERQYKLRKEALEAELELYEESSLERLQIEMELLDAERELWEQRYNLFTQWADQIGSLLDAITSVAAVNVDKQVAKFKAGQDAERKELETQYKRRLISADTYNARLAELDKELEDERQRLELQAARREKSLKIFSAITDTAAGIIKAVAQSPKTFGLPYSTFVAATGAAQIAAIASEPIKVAAKGMYISGDRHSNGGEWVNAEDGEVIINRRSVQMFGPVLSAINELGGGVPFNIPGSDGGFVQRFMDSDNAIDPDVLADAFSNIRIVTIVEDINRGQELQAQIESSGNIFEA